jgi:ABC-type phosphate/phosphonate transport system substrate-binding protein
MYDLPEIRGATDALWAAIARALREAGVAGVPDRLDHERDAHLLWADAHLLFAQACGFPLMHEFAGRLVPVAAPRYAVSGCAGGEYRSLIVARSDDRRRRFADFAGSVAAINAEDSHSGFSILRWRAAQEAARPFFGAVLRSGAHVASLAAVQAGQADLAAIDCVTFALLARHRPPAVAGIRLVEETPAAPALPYVTGPGVTEVERAAILRALRSAMADRALAGARATLLLEDVEPTSPAAYEAIVAFAREAGDTPLA